MSDFLENFSDDLFNKLGFKSVKYFIDNNFREKIEPIAGSVVYSDLYIRAEHSGIHIADGQISNIVVDSLLQAKSTVRIIDPEQFTEKSTLGKKIYVSCDKNGAVGNDLVAEEAESQNGQEYFYGLIFSNCHAFSTQCVNQSDKEVGLFDNLMATASGIFDITTEPTLRRLKATARKKLGATKWRLWDWQADEQQIEEPNWQDINDNIQNQALTAEYIEQLRQELADTQAYIQEISDENLPNEVMEKLHGFGDCLQRVSDKYDEVKGLLEQCPHAHFSYNQLMQLNASDLQQLSQELQHNDNIKTLAKKMGRNYIAEHKKKQARIAKASKSEVHGTHKSDDIMRLLPNELVNMDDDTLEMLFYARLIEQNLLTYELKGTSYQQGETSETKHKRTGPVVACLDTSGSMDGKPLHKAQASLLAIANILKQEKRSLYVILFGDNKQIKEFAMYGAEDIAGLMMFLQQGFGGGTDYQTPLQRSWQLIENEDDYLKADILMLSDGDCSLSDDFNRQLQQQKQQLDFSIYSVLCNGQRVNDNFSDEIVVL